MGDVWITRTPNNDTAQQISEGVDIELWGRKPHQLSREDGYVWDGEAAITDSDYYAGIVLRKLISGIGLRKGQCKRVKLVESAMSED